MNKLICYVNSEAFTIGLKKESNTQLKESLENSLPIDRTITTKDLLLAYIHKSQELLSLENEIKNELNKLENILKQDFQLSRYDNVILMI